MRLILFAAVIGFAASSFADEMTTQPIPTVAEMLKRQDADRLATIERLQAEIAGMQSKKPKTSAALRKINLQRLQSQLEAAKRSQPTAPSLTMAVGSFGGFYPQTLEMRVVRVLDGDSVLGELSFYQLQFKTDGKEQKVSGRSLLSSRQVIFRGVDAKPLVDDQLLELPKYLAVTGAQEIDGVPLLVLEPMKD